MAPLLIAALGAYAAFVVGLLLAGDLALPFDLVPDIIPIAGQADDAIVLAVVLRIVLRGGGSALLDEHRPGPPASLRVVRALAFGRG